MSPELTECPRCHAEMWKGPEDDPNRPCLSCTRQMRAAAERRVIEAARAVDLEAVWFVPENERAARGMAQLAEALRVLDGAEPPTEGGAADPTDLFDGTSAGCS